MKIYRVEHHKTRKGAFSSGAARFYDAAKVIDASCYDLPGVHCESIEIYELFFKDDIFVNPRGMRFGLVDLDQFKLWFECAAGRAAMAERGMVLSEYIVDERDIVFGNYQVVFKMRKATLSAQYDIVTMEEL